MEQSIYKKPCNIKNLSLLLAIPFTVFLFAYYVMCLGDGFNKSFAHSWWLSAGIVSFIIASLLTANAFYISKKSQNTTIQSLMFVAGILLAFVALVQCGWVINEIHRNAFPDHADWSALRGILNFSNYVGAAFLATTLFFTSTCTYLKFKY